MAAYLLTKARSSGVSFGYKVCALRVTTVASRRRPQADRAVADASMRNARRFMILCYQVVRLLSWG